MEGRNERRKGRITNPKKMRSVLPAEDTQYHAGNLKCT